MQIMGANIPKAVLSTMESPYGARAPYASSPHREAAAFCRHCLSFLTRGHNGITTWLCMQKMVYASCLFVLFFSFWDSILLVFWAQSTVHMVLAAPWMANVSVTLKPIRQDWEVWENRGLEEFVTERKVWRQRHRRYNNLLSAHLLSSIRCCWNAASSFEMPPRMADQGWKIAAVDKLTGSASHVSLLTPMHEQGAQWGPLSYWCHLSLSFIPPRSLEKVSHLKLSRSCLNPHC